MSERGGRQSQGQEKMSRKKQNKEIKEVKGVGDRDKKKQSKEIKEDREGWETGKGKMRVRKKQQTTKKTLLKLQKGKK